MAFWTNRLKINNKGKDKNMLKDKKTYAISVCMVLYAVTGLILGKVEANSAYMLIMEAMALSSLRHGVDKAVKAAKANR